MDKNTIIEKFILKLEKKLELIKDSIESEKQTAINAPASIQSWSDTTKYQSGKLAAQLEERYLQISNCIKAIKKLDTSKTHTKIEIGALVRAEKENEILYYFISPQGSGGEIINYNGYEVITLSTDSPLAQAMQEKKAKDTIRFKTPTESQSILIKEIG